MRIHVTEECWKKWEPVVLELAAEYEFPARSLLELNSILALYSGDGTTFRTVQPHWRFVIDTNRSGFSIVDVVSICVIARQEAGGKRDGWVISRSCDLHKNAAAAKVVANRDLAWYTVTSDGRSYQHCCPTECQGPYYAHQPTRNWDYTRLSIIQQSYAKDIVNLQEHLSKLKRTSAKRKRSDDDEDDPENLPVVKALRKSIETLERKKAKYKSGKVAADTTMKEAESKFENAESKAKEADIKISELREEMELVKRTLEIKKTQLKQVKSDMRHEVETREQTIADMKEQLEGRHTMENTKHNEGPASEIEDHRGPLMGMTATEVKAENAILQQVIQSQKSEIQRLESEAEKREDVLVEVEELRRRLSDQEHKLAERRLEVVRLQAAIKRRKLNQHQEGSPMQRIANHNQGEYSEWDAIRKREQCTHLFWRSPAIFLTEPERRLLRK
ncbi:uncharacterized protein CLUP02_16818 [Colletotrichum lupini]|uniref:Uncharacterized protein n=1 Tax=Colletotrichum lupini TaxID=145971 RepID=A0A9Q8WPW3_9PEZI|nr:uncharacterized protein CLUP02_16818 [Colletotrichum lupini]UQC91284.1 hypothetical protein CLUP02_16818 [Colletotrichum lupini]